jgi:hypothetical protein
LFFASANLVNLDFIFVIYLRFNFLVGLMLSFLYFCRIKITIKHIFLNIVLFVCLTNFSFSQVENERKVSSYLKELQEIFNQALVETTYKNSKTSSDSSLLVYFSSLSESSKNKYSPTNYFQAKEDLLRRENSLFVTAEALQNFNANPVQDLEDNISFSRRYGLGAEWNILKGGYLDSKNQLKSLEIDRVLQGELQKFSNPNSTIPIKMNQCIFWFNHQKTKILDQREDLLKKQSEIIEKLYFSKKIDKAFLLKNQTRIAEINGMKGIYESYNNFISPLFDTTFFNLEIALFDLNYAAFLGENSFNNQTKNNSTDSLSAVLLAAIENQNKWFHEIRLKTYVRYNYFDVISPSPVNRAFFSGGISSTIPLQFNHKQHNALEREKILKQIEELELNESNKRIELLNEAYEYRYQLKQYIVFHQKKIMLNESIRQERVKATLLDADFNPLRALELIDDLLQIEIELLDLKQNLYIKLLKIQEKVKHVSMSELIEPVFLPNYFSFEDETNRSVYIWTKTFESQNSEFISEYILYNQFDEVALAITKEDVYKEQKIKLIEDLRKNDIRVYLMLGQNNLLDSANPEQEISSILKQFPMQKVDGIHLDIEPHTRAEWKTNQISEQNKYKNLLKVTKSLSDTYKIKLSIDLPLSLDSNYVFELMKSADFVKFMCYENIKEDYLMRKLSPYLKNKANISISLRTEDFSNRNEMEEFSKLISQKTGIFGINFHDLNRLILLDKKTLEINEEH